MKVDKKSLEKNGRKITLTLAAIYDIAEDAARLIENGADVNETGEYGRTLLHLAADNDSKETAEILIKNGADVNAKDFYGDSPLALAVDSNSLALIDLLIKNGADVNAKDNHNVSLLHTAASPSRLEIAKILIENGADVNAICEDGWTPLDFATFRKSIKTADLLIKNGARRCKAQIFVKEKIVDIKALAAGLADEFRRYKFDLNEERDREIFNDAIDMYIQETVEMPAAEEAGVEHGDNNIDLIIDNVDAFRDLQNEFYDDVISAFDRLEEQDEPISIQLSQLIVFEKYYNY